jgi:opacity protein-like surface antigen
VLDRADYFGGTPQRRSERMSIHGVESPSDTELVRIPLGNGDPRMSRWNRRRVAVTAALLVSASVVGAQSEPRKFAGILIGVSTLSTDGRAVVSSSNAETSLYKPENGLAANLFAGFHLARYFSLQANYMWNRNDVTLVSTTTADGGRFYEQRRHSHQHAFVADTLVYFRPLGSGVRPYLGTGISFVRFSTGEIVRTVVNGFALPPGDITATKVGLRSHVGIDLALTRQLTARYSFSETISGNPISPHLTPRGERGLANFQNLFGILWRF